jgi:hypothetical protein
MDIQSSAAATRRKDFKKGIDAEESRRKREETRISIRKQKREEHLHKRRNLGTEFEDSPDGEVPVQPSAEDVEQQVSELSKKKIIDCLTNFILPFCSSNNCHKWPMLFCTEM